MLMEFYGEKKQNKKGRHRTVKSASPSLAIRASTTINNASILLQPAAAVQPKPYWQQMGQRNKGTAVYLQDLCLQHRYIRSRDTSAIYERPERLRAVKVGLAAALARLVELLPSRSRPSGGESEPSPDRTLDTDELAGALGRMNLAPERLEFPEQYLTVVQSSATVDILQHPAVKFIHGDVDGDVYLQNLKSWAKDSHDIIAGGGSEIPEGLSKGDLYRTIFL